MDFDRGCDANAFQPLAVDMHVLDREQQQAAANEECRRGEDSSLGTGTDDLAKPVFFEAIGKDLLAARGATVDKHGDRLAHKTWDLTGQVLANLSGLGIEHLIAIGGDDTLSYADKLNGLGVRIIVILKTMDNDVRNTEYCIGFSTAITRASDAIQRQRTTVGSHERIGIFGSLAATPDLRRSRPHTPPRSDASYRSTRSISTS